MLNGLKKEVVTSGKDPTQLSFHLEKEIKKSSDQVWWYTPLLQNSEDRGRQIFEFKIRKQTNKQQQLQQQQQNPHSVYRVNSKTAKGHKLRQSKKLKTES